MTDVSFVRTETLPEMPPPVAEQGIVKWLRENLFSSVASGILTIIALWAVYKFVAFALPWIANGVWNTESLAACREVLNGVRGACFSVLTERWNQCNDTRSFEKKAWVGHQFTGLKADCQAIGL